jgi:hypothetical protein
VTRNVLSCNGMLGVRLWAQPYDAAGVPIEKCEDNGRTLSHHAYINRLNLWLSDVFNISHEK